MTRTRSPAWLGAVAILAALGAESGARGPGPARRPEIVVRAGPHARKDSPVRFEIPEARLGPAVIEALRAGPVGLAVSDGAGGVRSIMQVDRIGDVGPARATWILPREIPAGGEARFRIEADAPTTPPVPWSIVEARPGALELKHGDRPVFRYNAAPVSSPNYGEIQARDAYIHPAYSPSGALITGDFSPYHPHHRGFFLAYERTRTGDLAPDFWNIHLGSGKIHADGFDRPVAGPVTARFSARHRWEARDKAAGTARVALRERWDVEAYDIPGSNSWLFDLTSTQQAVDRPMEVLPYRYGGMAYRGSEPFVKGPLDVLTSEGHHRRDGDQKPARWVDLTGPVAEGSGRYAGALIADHPGNPHAPTSARIHPTTLPFFCFVPAHDRALTLPPDAPAVFRYRILVHDGRPDQAVDDRAYRDFAEPPTVAFDPAGG